MDNLGGTGWGSRSIMHRHVADHRRQAEARLVRALPGEPARAPEVCRPAADEAVSAERRERPDQHCAGDDLLRLGCHAGEAQRVLHERQDQEGKKNPDERAAAAENADAAEDGHGDHGQLEPGAVSARALAR